MGGKGGHDHFWGDRADSNLDTSDRLCLESIGELLEKATEDLGVDYGE